MVNFRPVIVGLAVKRASVGHSSGCGVITVSDAVSNVLQLGHKRILCMGRELVNVVSTYRSQCGIAISDVEVMSVGRC